ncbi:MAG: CotH kinase family protein, partial [Eubacteriales bacterium]|nr:CotH kinase family protein [Eubacteriales bacterium]
NAVDIFSTGVLKVGITSGRKAGDESGQRCFFKTPTRGAANDSSAILNYTSAPEFSAAGGYISEDTQISMTCPTEGAKIYYTTDGSRPGSSSQLYQGPITVNKSMSLRAVAVADNRLDSEVITATYLKETKHDIPVVCISTAPAGLFDANNGIFADGPGYTEEFPHTGANYWKDWERAINFEFYEADGTLGVSFPAGIRVFGQYSRSEDQKSVSIHLRGAYGLSEVTYPFFRNYDVTTFSDLLLRTSGQDWVHTKFRDAFFAQAVKDTMDLDYMEYRPVAVYINGQYWGLYNLREKVNESYLENHHGVDGDNVDIIKGNKNALAGNANDFLALREYMKSHNLSDQAAYDYVSSVLDVENFMDYAIVETYFNNTDTGNIKFWREKTDTGKWRMILFDLDWGIFPSTYKWNMIEEFFDPNGHGVGNNFYTHIQCGLLQNAAWKEAFLKRYAWHINNTFQPERLNALVDQMAAEIRTEMPRHIARWGKPTSTDSWEKQVTQLKQMLTEKRAITIEDLKETFSISDAKMKELFPND